MSRGRYQHHTQQEANRIADLRRQGLTWKVIAHRFGFAEITCRKLAERAR